MKINRKESEESDKKYKETLKNQEESEQSKLISLNVDTGINFSDLKIEWHDTWEKSRAEAHDRIGHTQFDNCKTFKEWVDLKNRLLNEINRIIYIESRKNNDNNNSIKEELGKLTILKDHTNKSSNLVRE
jgi:hypothetical protein